MIVLINILTFKLLNNNFSSKTTMYNVTKALVILIGSTPLASLGVKPKQMSHVKVTILDSTLAPKDAPSSLKISAVLTSDV